MFRTAAESEGKIEPVKSVKLFTLLIMNQYEIDGEVWSVKSPGLNVTVVDY